MLSYPDFLNRIINDGIEAVRIDYADDKNRMEGSIAGFEACRGLDPIQLGELFRRASANMSEAMYEARDSEDHAKYWWHRCYQAEVEWVCNVVSSMLLNENLPPILHHLPTVRGMQKAAEILGVADH